ncbi:MAG: hypothetical protein JO154_19700 [Chitinophaga sp.]|uniref:hypothetical protein n=1 Tax=Chitinophaga sp. TaxID=1869181 RepID=UPI0025BCDDAF|nr:hypothetical protein [Chitinophaga sp.]MBV8254835.1 hypothetical protein [Chitinophaga sp.]
MTKLDNKISMEVLKAAVKQAVTHTEIRIRNEMEERVMLYKRLSIFLIIVLALVTISSLLLMAMFIYYGAVSPTHPINGFNILSTI